MRQFFVTNFRFSRICECIWFTSISVHLAHPLSAQIPPCIWGFWRILTFHRSAGQVATERLGLGFSLFTALQSAAK